MKKIIIVILALVQMSCTAQELLSCEDTFWTDGDTFFRLKEHVEKDGLYIAIGGTLHEGGLLFGLQGENGKYNVVETDNGEPKNSDWYMYGQTLFYSEKDVTAEVKTISGKRYILFSSGNELITVFHEETGDPWSENGNSLLDISEMLHRKVLFAGEYIDHKGDLVTFCADEQKVLGLTEGGSDYKIVELFDTPSNIVELSDGTLYSITHEDDGLLLTEMLRGNYDPEEMPTTEHAMKLYHVLPANMKGTAKKKSRFDFASDDVLYISSLGGFTSYELQLMRNEIYARHGYRFSTPKMNEYFSLCPWYSPRESNDDVMKELSETEKINVKMIKRVEKMKAEIDD
ncbi:MAG: YARHG domain-containing protein [Prevotella sp.]|uniref:YARHG domain-containing protein n=1 Tax=Prevotella sp. TaxID=59823 RepID=UPI002A2B48D6|nr:YARHG domain-containing protein [Prevotella sp.]MDD7317471.1 YARHG domain-containing protein [Prevotellaceae bacterium]MDY4019193.1 YARHG domain-containing protein [Prevotella sp.]